MLYRHTDELAKKPESDLWKKVVLQIDFAEDTKVFNGLGGNVVEVEAVAYHMHRCKEYNHFFKILI